MTSQFEDQRHHSPGEPAPASSGASGDVVPKSLAPQLVKTLSLLARAPDVDVLDTVALLGPGSQAALMAVDAIDVRHDVHGVVDAIVLRPRLRQIIDAIPAGQAATDDDVEQAYAALRELARTGTRPRVRPVAGPGLGQPRERPRPSGRGRYGQSLA